MTDEEQEQQQHETVNQQQHSCNLHKLLCVQELIFEEMQCRFTPQVEASGGQEQYYMCITFLLISCLVVVEVSHTLEYE